MWCTSSQGLPTHLSPDSFADSFADSCANYTTAGNAATNGSAAVRCVPTVNHGDNHSTHRKREGCTTRAA